MEFLQAGQSRLGNQLQIPTVVVVVVVVQYCTSSTLSLPFRSVPSFHPTLYSSFFLLPFFLHYDPAVCFLLIRRHTETQNGRGPFRFFDYCDGLVERQKKKKIFFFFRSRVSVFFPFRLSFFCLVDDWRMNHYHKMPNR